VQLLVTGFGPFAEAQDNPSGQLAQACGKPYGVLEVAYQAVDEFFDRLAQEPPEAILLIGVDVRARRMRLETVAHNRIGPKPDVRGEVWGPAPIDPLAPAQLAATLWTPEALRETEAKHPCSDAGGYLCNYSFFRAAHLCPSARVGFLHVPPFEALSKDRQLAEIEAILASCLDAAQAA
jgi:pyroglutamyl-peptidase